MSSAEEGSFSVREKRKRKLSPASFDLVALAGRGAFGKVGNLILDKVLNTK